jgi:1-acyl-sn-glycerol-3-phosphate acyltransferase
LHAASGMGPRVLLVLFRHTLGLWLRWRFRIKVVYHGNSSTLRPPFVVLANHVNFWDPFLVALPFRKPVHFIAADGNFRGRLMRRLMVFGGTVPKAKAKNDLESIRTLQHLVRRGNIVGIFPEGQRSWDGTSREVLPGTPKLVRLLGVPVVSVILKGGYLSMPRWTTHLRRGVLELHVKTVVTPDQLRRLDRGEITRQIAASVDHDETAWQKRSRRLFPQPRRAEHVEQALFHCPDCGSWDCLQSSGPGFRCRRCNTRSWMAPSGRIYRIDPVSGAPRYRSPDSVAGWNRLQLEALDRAVTSPTEMSALPVTMPSAEFLTGYRSRTLFNRGLVQVTLTATELVLTAVDAPPSGAPAPATSAHIPFSGLLGGTDRVLSVPVREISGIHVQYAHQLEFYRRQKLYVLRMLRPSDSAYRLEETVLALREITLLNKL